ncbi:MAG: hypothetical protein HY873_01810 [Chloroflexi bacterium]|nr:hypothetical protein [Chloroflexota bacterium]
MHRPHVVVLFQNRLFGEAIARALVDDARLEVTVLPVADMTAEELARIAPDAIVLEDQPATGDVKDCLLDAAPALTIVVGPEANTAEVYQRHEIIQATASEIIDCIVGQQEHRPRRRAPAARSPSQTSVEGPP